MNKFTLSTFNDTIVIDGYEKTTQFNSFVILFFDISL